MAMNLRNGLAVAALLTAISAAGPALAQKQGGILKMYSPDSPPTMSILEEATLSSQAPLMGVFNNLVMFDQHVRQDSLESIVPDLATGWSWNEDGTEVTFPLRRGVRWHDGKPFTAADVVCTWDLLMERSKEKLRFNPRKSFYKNLDQVTANGDHEVTFRLKRLQPAFLMLLSSGFSAIYPCDVPPAQMRQHPIGTGPFKFVEFKPNEHIRVAKKSGLLESGPALPRRHRIQDHPQPGDGGARVCIGAGRHDISIQPDDTAAEGFTEPAAAGDLRDNPVWRRQPPRAGQPHRAALRQPRSAPSDSAEH
jgi:peptide/nickel transport system substrate-binding protein